MKSEKSILNIKSLSNLKPIYPTKTIYPFKVNQSFTYNEETFIIKKITPRCCLYFTNTSTNENKSMGLTVFTEKIRNGEIILK